ncbi:DNA repair protein RecO [Mongoliitalea daihaiensis]|uniref:DNA repair protein RecO n=1 Tax=Mongoliitalea daihaiensis TaxID=2782006 RepID=UPI001F1EB7F4|nr:DNA repair protein RecO [Mongoliitalea daihaiensis]UJP66053.1 DNA repair protein RecO [Mongoliitalea daihaiensis]
MLVKTSGLVLSYIRYKDTSIIVKIFTKELGLKSYIINGVRSSTAKSKMGFYQPMMLLDLVVYHKETSNLNRVSEVKLLQAFQRIPFEFKRSGIAMFMAEVLSRCLYDGYQNESMFDFLEEAITLLDSPHCNLTHFPITFLMETSKYLGFAPVSAEEFFEELNQAWASSRDFQVEATYLDGLLQHSFAFDQNVPSIARRNLLDLCLSYYSAHLEESKEWKSIKILRQIMQET